MEHDRVTTPWELRIGDARRMAWKPFTCEQCGVEFFGLVRLRGRVRRFCAKACAAKFGQPQRFAKRGPDHYAWKGEAVSVRGGRSRALRLYPSVGPCTRCGAAKAERHHRDENTANNEPSNIAILCRRCHMETDGRMADVADHMREIQPLGVAARWS